MHRFCLKIFRWLSDQLTVMAVRTPSLSARTRTPSSERVIRHPLAPFSHAQTPHQVRFLVNSIATLLVNVQNSTLGTDKNTCRHLCKPNQRLPSGWPVSVSLGIPNFADRPGDAQLTRDLAKCALRSGQPRKPAKVNTVLLCSIQILYI